MKFKLKRAVFISKFFFHSTEWPKYKGCFKVVEKQSTIFVSNLNSGHTLLFYIFKTLRRIHCAKKVEIRSYLWSVFSCIGTEYGEIRSTGNTGKYGPEITPYLDTFLAVTYSLLFFFYLWQFFLWSLAIYICINIDYINSDWLTVKSAARFLVCVWPFLYRHFALKGSKDTTFERAQIYRSSLPEVFLEKYILKICSKLTGQHPCRSVISIKLLCNFFVISDFFYPN